MVVYVTSVTSCPPLSISAKRSSARSPRPPRTYACGVRTDSKQGRLRGRLRAIVWMLRAFVWMLRAVVRTVDGGG
eukprot:3559647-Pyramimonas_sp.AAC.1